MSVIQLKSHIVESQLPGGSSSVDSCDYSSTIYSQAFSITSPEVAASGSTYVLAHLPPGKKVCLNKISWIKVPSSVQSIRLNLYNGVYLDKLNSEVSAKATLDYDINPARDPLIGLDNDYYFDSNDRVEIILELKGSHPKGTEIQGRLYYTY